MSGTPIRVFRPAHQDTRSVAATTTSGNVQIVFGNAAPNLPEINVRVFNAGTSICMIAFGDTNAVAATDPSGSTAGSIPIAPGATENFRLSYGAIFAAAKIIAGGNSGTIYFTPGFGI